MPFACRLALAFAALFISAAASAADTSSTITLTSYNIHSGVPDGQSGSVYFATPADMANVADVLTTTGASIIALQEVRNLWTRPGAEGPNPCTPDLALLLAGHMKMNYAFGSTCDAKPGLPENREYRQWGTFDQWTNNGAPHGEYGNAVLSKYSMSEPQILKLPLGDAEAQKRGDEPRNAVRVELSDVPGLGKVIVYGTHFQHNNGATREAQMKYLLEHARQDATTATVFLMGDFNHSPHPGEPDLLGMVKAAGFHDLAADYAAANKTQPLPTINEGLIGLRIDYIFCSKPLKVSDVKVLHTNVSDHFPLAVTVQP